jgi:hypothetical protein
MSLRPESELAALVITYLQDLKWKVYKEVKLKKGRIDIVAVQDQIIWAIECKTTFGLAVLEQAYAWLGDANYVSVATPHYVSDRFRRDLLRHYGIGALRVGHKDCTECIAPVLRRRIGKSIRSNLHPEQLTAGIPGTSNSDYYTPFRATCRNLYAYVLEHPLCTIGEAILAITHHYRSASTAKSSMRVWLHDGKVPGLRLRKEGRKLLIEISPKEN